MERETMNSLIEWKNSEYRKPLLLQGIRQVGKTWLLKEFGRQYYENTAYFNFDEHPEYAQFFETTKNVNRIIENLQFAIGHVINKQSTLIIFDEIQETPNVINSLKYFHENGKEYHLACAGSLLGVTLAKSSSFPVGQVDFLNINPMTFREFLVADGEINLTDYLSQKADLEPIADLFFNQLEEKFRMYFILGGMPEVINRWVKQRDISQIEEVLYSIILSYERDFTKHPEPKEFPKINRIFNSLPSQLGKENKRFLYQLVRKGARAREYEDALMWLVSSQIVKRVARCTKIGLPLAAYEDLSTFKLYLADVALLRRLGRLDSSLFLHKSALFTEFKGALSENYILQALSNVFKENLWYWVSDDNRYEVDFLLQYKNTIIPIEVKSSTNTKSLSLKAIKRIYSDSFPLRIRYSLQNLSLNDDLLSIPLFLADYTSKFIEIALKNIE